MKEPVNITVNEKSHLKKRPDIAWFDFIYMKCPKYTDLEQQELYSWLLRAGGGGQEWGLTVNGYRVSFGNDKNDLKF